VTRSGASWGATIGAIAGYTAAVLLPLTPLQYAPHLGAWRLGAGPPGEIVVRWFGFVVYAAVGGALGAVLGGLVVRRPPWSLVAPAAALAWLALAAHELRWFRH
jgi:hypothetical protein